MRCYINFYFRNLEYDEKTIMGDFLSKDDEISCSFSYHRETEEIEIWNNNKPIEEIVPLPIHWLLYKLKENGTLRTNESKISY